MNDRDKPLEFDPINQIAEMRVEREYYCGYCRLKMKSKDSHLRCSRCGKEYELMEGD